MAKKNLFEALGQLTGVDQVLCKDRYAELRHDGVLMMCPLTTLVVQDGWFTKTQIELLLSCSKPGELDQPLTTEVMLCIEKEYEDGDLASWFTNIWDSWSFGGQQGLKNLLSNLSGVQYDE
jgi:hypothetical protein